MTEQPSEASKTPSRAFGRNIHDFWLEDGKGISDPHEPPRYGEECRLWAAEWRLLEACATGEWLECDDKIPFSASRNNRVRAPLLRFICLGGDENHPLHDHGVQTSGVYVEGDLDFFGTVLPENLSFNFCRFQNVNFEDCCAESLNFDGSLVRSMRANRLEASGSVFLQDGFTVIGELWFGGAKIAEELSLNGALLESSQVGLMGDRLQTGGSLFLSFGFVSKGLVSLCGAKIGGQLACRQGRFLDSEIALKLDSTQVGGDLFLDEGLFAKGQVSVNDVQIRSNLRCSNATFSGKGVSINAPNLKVGNSVYFNQDCRVRGEISLQSAEIGDSITFEGGSFETKGQINLRNAKIGNMLTWRGVEYLRGELNLAGAACNSLNMDEKSWELPSQIRMDNFRYGRFAELPKGCNPPFWRRWLERQPPQHLNEKFRPNPYQQLATVLENMGHEEEAREMRIERRERQRLFTLNHVPMPKDFTRRGVRHLSNFWNWVQKKVIGHGYRPGFAVIWLSVIVMLGTGIYWKAGYHGIMTPTHPLIFKEAIWEGPLDEMPKGRIPAGCRENWVHPPEPIKDICASAVASEYSTFSALIYSLDTAIPVVNFRMENDWSPRVVDWQTGDTGYWWNPTTWQWGWYVRTWEWIQIGLGWALSLLFVSAIGGVIRRD